MTNPKPKTLEAGTIMGRTAADREFESLLDAQLEEEMLREPLTQSPAAIYCSYHMELARYYGEKAGGWCGSPSSWFGPS